MCCRTTLSRLTSDYLTSVGSWYEVSGTVLYACNVQLSRSHKHIHVRQLFLALQASGAAAEATVAIWPCCVLLTLTIFACAVCRKYAGGLLRGGALHTPSRSAFCPGQQLCQLRQSHPAGLHEPQPGPHCSKPRPKTLFLKQHNSIYSSCDAGSSHSTGLAICTSALCHASVCITASYSVTVAACS